MIGWIYVVWDVVQFYGWSRSASESCRFLDEEGAGLLCNGFGEATETIPGHPGRVRAYDTLTLEHHVENEWMNTQINTSVRINPLASSPFCV